MNLLDLNNDVLNIVGDYVKRDNVKKEIFKSADKWLNHVKKTNRLDSHAMFFLVWVKLYDCYGDEIDEYIKTRDLEDFE